MGVNTLIGSIDKEAHQRIVLVHTGYGLLVGKIRWFKTHLDGFNIGGQQTSIEFKLVLRADSGIGGDSTTSPSSRWPMSR